jgi:TonB family protein
VTKTEISRSGKTKLVTTYKICINVNGDVSQVNMLKSSGFPSYDSKISREMKSWKYRPYSVDGQAKPVCTSVTFIYQQKN